MRREAVFRTVAVVLALGLTGCGGSSHRSAGRATTTQSPLPSLPLFISTADNVCEKHPFHEPLRGLTYTAATARTVAPQLRATGKELATLNPPASEASAFRQFISAEAALARLLDRGASTAAVNALDWKRRKLAMLAGLDSCAFPDR